MARTLMILLVLLCSSATLVTCNSAGLRMKLTHVDDKGSYTTAERVRRAVTITRQRLASMQAAASGDVSAPVHWATRQYIAEYLIGDPPQRAEAVIDTGSDLIWTQCTTCLRGTCAKQDLPYYNSSRSSSFEPVPCMDRLCMANDVHGCARDGTCTFRDSYDAGDIAGSLGTEVITFQSGTATLAFGCVNATKIKLGSLYGASGLIGLGRGSLSLVSQTGATKFSYCLTPYFRENAAPSHLFVGASASLSGDGPVMSMLFVKNPYSPFYYYLPLVGLTVGHTKLPIASTLFELRQDHSGGVIIDSGSPFTLLVDGAYQALREELARQLNRSLVPPQANTDLELCVAPDDVDKLVPPLVLHFGGGADMALPPKNYWEPVDKSTACMTIGSGGSDQMSIIGNFQQQNMHLLYDLGRGQLSFQTADCSAL